MILGVARCFVVISICLVSVSAEDKGPTERFLNNLKDKSRAVELKRIEVATANVEEVFGDAVSGLQTVNAFIFEYRGGKRILGDELLLWDTKSWKFPKQDVSLLIKYPENPKPNSTTYYMTYFQSFISQDARDSHGYLISGGYGHTRAELEFKAKKAKYMGYDIRIFGIRSDLVRNRTEVFGEYKDS